MGYIACIAGALLLSFKDLSSKVLSLRLSGIESAFGQFAYSLPYYLVVIGIAWCLGIEQFHISATFVLLALLRSINDCFAEYFKMEALAAGDISLLISFLYMAPVFVLIISPFVTGDSLSMQGVVGVLIVVAASLILVRPNRGVKLIESRRGILLALSSAAFFSLNHCFDKLIVRHGSPLLSGFTMTLFAAALLFPVAYRKAGLQDLKSNSRVLWLRGFFEIGSMVAKLYAMQYLAAAYVVGIMRVSLVFSIVGGRMIFREVDFGLRLLAGAVTLLGVVLIIFSN